LRHYVAEQIRDISLEIIKLKTGTEKHKLHFPGNITKQLLSAVGKNFICNEIAKETLQEINGITGKIKTTGCRSWRGIDR
jgi:hypothetical protein